MGCNVSKDKADPEHRSKKKDSVQQENGVHEPAAEPLQQTEENSSQKGEIIIDTSDPEVEQAATKIQAAFRGSQARKNLHNSQPASGGTQEGSANEEDDNTTTATNDMQAPAKGDGDEEIDIDLTDPEVNQAAAKIQASFRGHKVRKEMKKQPPEEKDTITNVPKEEDEEVVDIDLNDPDVQKAATKIQASFRGHLVRKQTGEQK